MAKLFSWIPLRTSLIFLVGISVISFICFSLLGVSFTNVDEESNHLGGRNRNNREIQDTQLKLRKMMTEVNEKRKNLSNLISDKDTNIQDVVKVPPKAIITLDHSKLPPLNYDVHIFYYPWYKSKAIDGKFAHWNHEQLPNWKSKDQMRRRQYVPPDDIGADFYPQLGAYSSSDPHVVDIHMQQMRAMGVGVLSMSWYPPHYEKSSETPVDDLMMLLFDSAAKYGLKIAFHIEPYENRSGETLKEVVKFIIHKYGNHSAFYRADFHGRQLPVYYIYDSYQIDSTSWAQALKQDGKHSIRNTKYDGVFLGLLVESNHLSHLTTSGFDGFYTYFATNGMSYGSSWKNWRVLASKAKQSGLVFVPSIGPGYLDTRVRPWNSQNTRLRLKGQYYRSSFYSAMAVRPKFLSITSFNEWHEGTQVEPAVPKTISGYTYHSYKPHGPEYYLNMTRQFVKEYAANMSQPVHHHDNGF